MPASTFIDFRWLVLVYRPAGSWWNQSSIRGPPELIRRAFPKLYRRHPARSTRHLRSRVDAAAAPEFVAETFAQAARALQRFRDEKEGSAPPWPCGIAGH